MKPRSFSDTIRAFGLAALWALAAAWMLHDSLRDPYDPSLQGTRAYGHNHETALRDGLVVSLVELAVLHAVLRPWKKTEHAWLRILMALVLLLPWTLFSALVTMHAGGVVSIHLLWLVVLVLVLVAALVACGVSALARRTRS